MSETAEVAPHWTLGWRLQRSLAWAGVSVEEMARELDVSRSTISRWCHDQGAAPRTIYLRAWAHKCRVPYEWLQYGDEGPDDAKRSNITRIMEDQPAPSRDEILSHAKRIDALREQLHGPSRRGPISRAEIGNTSVISSAVRASQG